MKIVYQQKNYDDYYYINNKNLNYYNMHDYSKNKTSINFILSKINKLF